MRSFRTFVENLDYHRWDTILRNLAASDLDLGTNTPIRDGHPRHLVSGLVVVLDKNYWEMARRFRNVRQELISLQVDFLDRFDDLAMKMLGIGEQIIVRPAHWMTGGNRSFRDMLVTLGESWVSWIAKFDKCFAEASVMLRPFPEVLDEFHDAADEFREMIVHFSEFFTSQLRQTGSVK